MTLFELQAWLGHRSLQATQHYAKITPTKLAKAYRDAGYFARNVRARLTGRSKTRALGRAPTRSSQPDRCSTVAAEMLIRLAPQRRTPQRTAASP
jgi:hypothetical protein